MSSYTCPDCEDGSLEAKVREVDLELADGETAQIVAGVVVITSVGCNNGCSEEAAKPKAKKKKDRTAVPAAAGGACARSPLCSKAPGHPGRCDTKLAEHAHA